MLKCHFIVLLTISCSAAFTPELDRVRNNLDRTGERIFLLSYPCSGNTWLRYCLEFLTQRPSLSRIGLYYKTQQPLGWAAQFTVDLEKTPIEKVHCRRELVGDLSVTDKLILLVRNPKETFGRRGLKALSLPMQRFAGKGYGVQVHFDNFDIYTAWNNENKLLVYYEDLLLNPRETLEKILLFLREPDDRLDLFMSEYSRHQACSIELYKHSRPTVNDTLFHSKKLSADDRHALDEWMACNYPEWWTIYLKERYAEDSLVHERNICES